MGKDNTDNAKEVLQEDEKLQTDTEVKAETAADKATINEANSEKEAADDEAKEVSELKNLKAKNEELNENLLRSYAEFDNFKKRTLKEKEEMTIYAKTLCLKDILSVIDNFERALSVECKDENFKKGMSMIFTQLDETMKKLGVEEIKALNCPFDPDLHNAVNQIENIDYEENTVCEVMQKGYKIGNRVIRHAMVTVANP